MDEKMSLAMKELAIMEHLSKLEKDKKHKNQGWLFYSIENVKSVSRALFSQYKIVFDPEMVDSIDRGNGRITNKYLFTLTDGESGEKKAYRWEQHGTENQFGGENLNPVADGIITSYAVKNWFLAKFLVTDKDDFDIEEMVGEQGKSSLNGNSKVTQMPPQNKQSTPPAAKPPVKDIPVPPKENKQEPEKPVAKSAAQKSDHEVLDEFLSWANTEYKMTSDELKAWFRVDHAVFHGKDVDAYKKELKKHFDDLQKEREWANEMAAQEITEPVTESDPFSGDVEPEYNGFKI